MDDILATNRIAAMVSRRWLMSPIAGAMGRLAPGFACLLIPTSAATAEISITPAVVVFEGGPPENPIVVTNTGTQLAFITARVRIVDAPGESDEKLRFEPNPASAGLLATPNRVVLEPGEQRAIQLVTMNSAGSADRVWRVHIAPSIGKLREGQSGVAFEIAYDALIIQRAAQAKPAIRGQRSGKQLLFTNYGNSFAVIRDVQQCLAAACTTLPGRRLYAGKSWTAELLDASEPVAVTVEVANGRKETLRF